jgi:hypothetical protein
MRRKFTEGLVVKLLGREAKRNKTWEAWSWITSEYNAVNAK